MKPNFSNYSAELTYGACVGNIVHMRHTCVNIITCMHAVHASASGQVRPGGEGMAGELSVYPPIYRLGAPGRWIRKKLMAGSLAALC